ncbi:hypothetical protein PhaeoP30_02497 [Phaeobacter inhibens]|nr:hypothetical protein PhaeoP10_02671 [Phaeobacter inhibens]AUQ59389.1 hypothetical protein PhaeoP30_02497 [Phaeobacter inhibens]
MPILATEDSLDPRLTFGEVRMRLPMGEGQARVVALRATTQTPSCQTLSQHRHGIGII